MIVLLQIALLLITVAFVVEVHRHLQRRSVQRATQHWIEAIRSAPEHGSLPTLGRSGGKPPTGRSTART